ncbi:hypothetical protein Tco_0497866 [Tanacetum coccineum]
MLTEAPTSSHFLSQLLSRKVVDLELPADVDGDTEGKQPLQNVQNFTDLNKHIQVEEASFSASIINNKMRSSWTGESVCLMMARHQFIRRVANGNVSDKHVGATNAVAQDWFKWYKVTMDGRSYPNFFIRSTLSSAHTFDQRKQRLLFDH